MCFRFVGKPGESDGRWTAYRANLRLTTYNANDMTFVVALGRRDLCIHESRTDV